MVRSKGGGGEWSEVKEEGSGQKQGRGGVVRSKREGREWSEVREGEGVVRSKGGEGMV